ncbi:hypothetical protein MASR1M74_02040 [Lentimicrobium sp.]
MFNLDFQKLINNLLPWFLRGPRMRAWLEVLSSPVAWLHQKFTSQRDDTIFSVSHNGQVISLEDMLNQVFNPDNAHQRIYISDSQRKTKVYLYNKSENKSTRFHNLGESFPPVYLLSQNEPSGLDFTVWVHSSIPFDYDHMFSLVAGHKAAGFQFQIKTF